MDIYRCCNWLHRHAAQFFSQFIDATGIWFASCDAFHVVCYRCLNCEFDCRLELRIDVQLRISGRDIFNRVKRLVPCHCAQFRLPFMVRLDSIRIGICLVSFMVVDRIASTSAAQTSER
jgi:hypothetical protein